MTSNRKTPALAVTSIAEANQSLTKEIDQLNKQTDNTQDVSKVPINPTLIEHYISSLHAQTEHDIEIRICPNNKTEGIYPKTFFSRDMSKLIQFIEDEHTSANGVYVGMATRTKGLKSGKAIHCEELPCLWVDLDCDKDGLDRQECSKILQTCKYPPSLIIDSGGGLHAYWLLTQAHDLKIEHHDKIKKTLKGLAHIFAGDMAVCDIARIMRVAGTCNTKLDQIRPVTILTAFLEQEANDNE